MNSSESGEAAVPSEFYTKTKSEPSSAEPDQVLIPVLLFEHKNNQHVTSRRFLIQDKMSEHKINVVFCEALV